MLELTVLSAVMVLFKAAFAGEDLDRKVGADIVSTVITGLLRTTSPTDPVLLKVHEIVQKLDSRAYDQAMAAGHRYLAEARLGTARTERLMLARERLVDAASAAEAMKVPMLLANAEFAVAKCDALLASPEHAAMALDRASAALEQALEGLDASGLTHRLRMLDEAKFKQNNSVSDWLTRAAGGDLVRQRDLDELGKSADALQAQLQEITSLYSEVQTARLGSTGHGQPVVWAQRAGETVRTGLDAKAVTTVTGQAAVRGFGLTLQVERQTVLPGADGGLTVELMLNLTVHDDRRLYCRAFASPHARPAAVQPRLWNRTLLGTSLNPAGATTFLVTAGEYHRPLTVPVQGQAVELVKIRISRPVGGGRFADPGACIDIPITV